MADLAKQVFKMYHKKKLAKHELCRACRKSCRRKKMDGPVSLWHVGENFRNDQYKILFVGKTARNHPGKKNKHGIYDARERADELIEESWPYWSYTKAILAEVYGDADKGWKRSAMTDLLKCNNSKGYDTATDVMKENCIQKLGVFSEEVKLLRPKLIILFTGRSYDEYLGGMCFGDYRVERKDGSVRKGRRKLCWWDREYFLNGKPLFRFLRVAHPQFQNKDWYVGKIAKWIKRAAEEWSGRR